MDNTSNNGIPLSQSNVGNQNNNINGVSTNAAAIPNSNQSIGDSGASTTAVPSTPPTQTVSQNPPVSNVLQTGVDPLLTNKEYPEDLDARWSSWKCLVCGYVYEGQRALTICPRCSNDDPDKFDDA